MPYLPFGRVYIGLIEYDERHTTVLRLCVLERRLELPCSYARGQERVVFVALEGPPPVS